MNCSKFSVSEGNDCPEGEKLFGQRKIEGLHPLADFIDVDFSWFTQYSVGF
ncbi:MAG: hypothetical protein WCR47_01815 [Desulfoplanes sp.]